MRLYRLAFSALLVVCVAPAAGRAAAPKDPLAKWFGSQTCAALDGLYSGTKAPPPVKTGDDELVVKIPKSVIPQLKESMTAPWYVYDPRTRTALSHIGQDSGVVETLRVVSGAPPRPVPNVDLSGAGTRSGIRLGASATSVVRTLGKPLVIHACGMERYEYNDTNDPTAEPNDLDFTIKDGRVIEIVHTSWG